MTKRIITACGNGVATSQTVASKVNRMLKADGIDAKCDACDIRGIEREIPNSDAYISITSNKVKYDIPTFNGIAWLTGMGVKEEYAKLLEALGFKK